MDSQHSVLIVDRSEETREVLQTVLERRGVRTLAAGRTETGLELARRHQPDLIVLDLELDDGPCGEGVSPDLFAAGGTPAPQSEQYRPRMVLLGNLRGWRDRLPEGEFVSKPYHYGSLIRKIEELLASGSKGDCPHLCEAPSGPFRQMGAVPFTPPSGSLGRADAVCHPRCRPGQPLRADRADHPAGSRCV